MARSLHSRASRQGVGLRAEPCMSNRRENQYNHWKQTVSRAAEECLHARRFVRAQYSTNVQNVQESHLRAFRFLLLGERRGIHERIFMKIGRHNHSKGSWKLLTSTLAFLLAITTLAACSNSTASTNSGAPGQTQSGDIHKIKHVVVIMQENRSFDSYFGTLPGADGIPMQDGLPTVCIPDPQTNQCVKPYHDPNDMNFGGPHGASNAAADINGDAMDGFIQQELKGSTKACRNNFNPACSLNQKQPDVMGYHDAREIPNYWAYAEQFVLQDHMFEPNASWSLPEHLFMVSEWSAVCTRPGDPMSCQNALQNPSGIRGRNRPGGV